MNFMTILLTLTTFYSTSARALNWAQLRNVLASGNLTQLSRTPEIEKTYLEFRNNLRDRNMTVPQHVKQNIFGFTGRPKDPMHHLKTMSINDIPMPVYVTGPQLIWREFIKQTMQPTPVAGIQEDTHFVLFAINDFPYSLDKINHWVVWSSFQFHSEIQEILLSQIMHEDVERLSYENPVTLKSIPEINHFQLFWRKKIEIIDQL